MRGCLRPSRKNSAADLQPWAGCATDVSADARYLACSLETKSQIVAPIFVAGKAVGELDIDSHFRAAFAADEDRKLGEHAAKLLGKWMETHPNS